jgi:hypothetical protein
MFLFKKKKIILDCFTYNSSAYEYGKIERASKFYPDWWKNTPKENPNKPPIGISTTNKTCPGFIENYQYGVMLPLWTDLTISVNGTEKSYRWQYADMESRIEIHGGAQWDTYADPNTHIHLKIITPWLIKCKEDVPFMYMRPYWNYQPFSSISVPTGIVNYKYQHGTNFNMYINTTLDAHIELKHGDPLAHMIPIDNREVTIHNHLIDNKEYDKIFAKLKFNGNYNRVKKLMQEKESKCPFHSLWSK